MIVKSPKRFTMTHHHRGFDIWILTKESGSHHCRITRTVEDTKAFYYNAEYYSLHTRRMQADLWTETIDEHLGGAAFLPWNRDPDKEHLTYIYRSFKINVSPLALVAEGCRYQGFAEHRKTVLTFKLLSNDRLGIKAECEKHIDHEIHNRLAKRTIFLQNLNLRQQRQSKLKLLMGW